MLFASPQDWQYHASARFVIAHASHEKTLAMNVLIKLQESDRQLAQYLEFEPSRTITVFLCPTREMFRQMAGEDIPDWSEALAETQAFRILLRSPKASASRDLNLATLKHELAHLLLAEMSAPQQLPRWFNEGAAILLSSDMSHVEPLLISRAMSTNSLVTFEDVESVLSFPNAAAGLAYTESYHAAKFLVRRHGHDAIRKFALALSTSHSAEEAFRSAVGEDLFDFEVAYFDHLRRSFRWYFLMDDYVIFSGVILILIVAGFIATRWRASRKLREWEKEEKMEPEVEWHDAKEEAE